MEQLHQNFLKKAQDFAKPDDVDINDSSSELFVPTSPDKFFDKVQDLKIEGTEDVFRVYQINPEEKKTVFVFHHGAGLSGLSYALLSEHLKSLNNNQCGILCYDCRGHGKTHTSNDEDLSLGTLSQDLVNICNALYPDPTTEFILVGHSLGGAIVADVASKQMLKKIFGLIVIDVVEGTALESLVHMQNVLLGRPTSFKSETEAIKWSITSHTIRNIESAKISVPSQLRKISGKTGDRYIWRANLTASEKYWEEWYKGLSDKFLSTKAPKLLIIASPDRLDKPLTIGQMQGKFQMEIFPECGHLMNEDAPDKIAAVLNDFYSRNKVFIPKRFNIPLRPSNRATAPKK